MGPGEGRAVGAAEGRLAVAEPGAVSFGSLLRQLRDEAGLTQDELAEAARVSQRAISDLERGVNRTARKDTAVLLADALSLAGHARELFVAAARGRMSVAEALPRIRDDRASGSAAAASRTLPRDIASFTGRQQELSQAMRHWAIDAESSGVVSIHSIGGMAGIGKTTFAIHLAHLMADRFPDGQFFLPLHGHTPGQRPVKPADGLASLLLTVGVPAQQIPPGTDARSARWRDYVSGKKILLLLDDATGHEQVRPLLPGTPQSLVLITSRRRLAALEDAEVVSLDALAPDEASELFVALAGRPGLSADDPAVGQIAALCGYLPLAIGIVGRQLAHHPAWNAKSLAHELAAAHDRLGLIAAESMSVAAAFDLSYRDLSFAEQRLFRRLGMQPGADIDASAAAALDETNPSQARRSLEDLYDQHLITQPAPGRYRFHDLLREHARRLADGDPPDSRAAAERLLDYYRDTSLAASGQIAARVRGSRRPQPVEPPACAPPVSDSLHAAHWLGVERANLFAAADYAAANGYPEHTAQIANAFAGFLFFHGYWDQIITLQRTVLSAEQRARNFTGQAGALNQLCLAQTLTNDLSTAAESNRRALALYRDLGDLSGQGDVMHSLSLVHQMAGDYPAGVAAAQQALDLYRETSDRLGEADALNQLGIAQAQADSYADAISTTQRALDLSRDLDDKLGQAVALDILSRAQLMTGSYPAATANIQLSIELFREVGDQQGEAASISCLSWAQRWTGDCAAANVSLRQSLQLFREMADWRNVAVCLTELGVLQQTDGEYSAAAASHQQALQWFRDSGDRPGQGTALCNLGALQTSRGEYAAATASLSQALKIFRAIAARVGEAEVMNNLGQLLTQSSADPVARDHHTRALAISQELGVPHEEARALEGIGNSHLSDQESGQAAEALRQALAIYQRIGSPGAQRVRQTLDEHGL